VRTYHVPALDAFDQVPVPVALEVRLVAHGLQARAVRLEVEEQQLLPCLAHLLGLGFRVQGPGFRVQGSGFRV